MILYRAFLWAAFSGTILMPPWTTAQTALDPCGSTDEPHRLLARMLDAHSGVSYSASVLFERAGQRQFLTIKWPAGSDTGVLKRMNGAVDPRAEDWPAPVDSAGRLCALIQAYIISVEPGRVIAGRSTQRLSLKPRDTLRLGHVAEVDDLTGLTLAMLTIGSDGRALERYEFATIAVEFNETARSAVPQSVKSIQSLRLDAQKVVLPGYFLVSEDASQGSFVVTDGLATASVFIEPLSGAVPVGEGVVTNGATLTYTRGVQTSSGAILISVLGEVPLVTARLLADAVRPSASGS
jgi:hypothetical protein